MLKSVSILFSILLFLSACSSPYDKELKISVNAWVGYSPLFYAYDKGWLDEYNIKVLHVVSLAESMYIYNAKNADAFSGTQYEYSEVKKREPNLTPIMMFDQSYGGDMVMGNRALNEYQSNNEKIDSYLEINSVNSLILKDFINFYKIDANKINYINMDQESISALKSDKNLKKSLIVTYAPYNVKLKHNGFRTLASTKDSLSITVVDGLYATQKVLTENKEQFKSLKIQTDRAIEALKKDPKEFHSHVKHYLQDISFEEFEATLGDIKWINQEIPKELSKKIQEMDFPLNGLI